MDLGSGSAAPAPVGTGRLPAQRHYVLFVLVLVGTMNFVDRNIATAAACVLVVINAMVVGVAPQVVGILSDLLRPAFGEESLRVALLSATMIALPTALLFFLASRTYPAELDAVATRNQAAGAA